MFAGSIVHWPVFPDTIQGLHNLKRHFKLVILSNVDHEPFHQVLAGTLAGAEFDAVYTSEDIRGHISLICGTLNI